MRVLFEDADDATQRFYSRLFWNVLINLRAVELGIYDTLLCETNDPYFALRWREDLPWVLTQLRSRNGGNHD